MRKNRKKRSKVKNNQLQSYKAKVRGLIGAAKSSSFYNNDLYRKKDIYYHGLNESLTHAREVLSLGKFQDYLHWAEKVTQYTVPTSIGSKSLELKSLSYISEVKEMPFGMEVNFAINRLDQSKLRLLKYLLLKEKIETAFWRQQSDVVYSLLAEMEKELGWSIWLVETRFAIDQHFKGLEEQKLFLEEVKKRAGKGFLRFLAYRFSMRNEPAVSIARYNYNIRDLLSKHNITEDLKAYIKYKLSGNRVGEDEAASIIRISQNHSDIDLYEALVNIIQDLSVSSKSKFISRYLSLIDLEIVKKDKRLLKIASFKNLELRKILVEKEFDSIEFVFKAKAKTSLFKELRFHNKTNDPLSLIIAAQTLSLSLNFHDSDDKLSRSNVVRKLSNVFSRNSLASSSFSWLEKNLVNYSVFDSYKTLYTLLIKVNRNIDGFGSWVFNEAPYLITNKNILDFNVLPKEDCQLLALDASPMLVSVISSFLHNDKANTGSEELDTLVNLQIMINKKRYREALTIIQSIKCLNIYPALQDRLKLLEVDCLIEVGEDGGAISLMAELISEESQISDLIEVGQLVGSYTKWADIKRYAHDISLSIVLDHAYKKNPNDLLASHRRTAVDAFVRQCGFKKPSQIFQTEAEQNTKKLVYFYRCLCVTSVIDMCRGLKGTRAIEEERREILSNLIKLDNSRKDEYQEEILSITNNLRIKEGLKVVDGSRIYVDVEGISRWAKKELAESVSRYRTLVKAGVGVAKDFDLLLEDMLNGEADERDYFEIPDSEADEVLITMLFSIRDAFLFDKPNGLDSYLSKRVRHNSIAGYLRGPLESYNLITLKNAEGDYIANSYWRDRLEKLGVENKDVVLNALKRFGVKFDTLTAHIKNEALQVRSKSNPKGMIDLTPHASVIHVARSALQSFNYELDYWLETCYSMFWSLLEPSLGHVRKTLVRDYKNRFVEIFNELIKDLYEQVGREAVPADLISNIHDARNEVQVLIDRAADWFTKREGDLSKYSYTVDEMLDIAIESALSRHTGCSLNISRNINPSLVLRSDSLTLFADIVLIVIGNISEHSGCRESAELKVFCDLDKSGEILRLGFESSVKPGSVKQDKISLVEHMKGEIVSGKYLDKIAVEGLSGLYKIASIAKREEIGDVDFGFFEDCFFLNIALPYKNDGSKMPPSHTPVVGEEIC